MKLKILVIIFVLALLPTVTYAWDSGLGLIKPGVSSTSATGQKQIALTGDISITLGGLVKGASGFVGVIFFIMVVYAGILWMTAAGNDEKISKAKKIIIDGAIGVIIALGAFMITTLVTNRLAVSSNSSTQWCCWIQDEGCNDVDVQTYGLEKMQASCQLQGGTLRNKVQ